MGRNSNGKRSEFQKAKGKKIGDFSPRNENLRFRGCENAAAGDSRAATAQCDTAPLSSRVGSFSLGFVPVAAEPVGDQADLVGAEDLFFAERGHAVVAVAVEIRMAGVVEEFDEPRFGGVAGEVGRSEERRVG